jgi:hypothetical protein
MRLREMIGSPPPLEPACAARETQRRAGSVESQSSACIQRLVSAGR